MVIFAPDAFWISPQLSEVTCTPPQRETVGGGGVGRDVASQQQGQCDNDVVDVLFHIGLGV